MARNTRKVVGTAEQLEEAHSGGDSGLRVDEEYKKRMLEIHEMH